jgi:hypothetical protein
LAALGEVRGRFRLNPTADRRRYLDADRLRKVGGASR